MAPSNKESEELGDSTNGGLTNFFLRLLLHQSQTKPQCFSPFPHHCILASTATAAAEQIHQSSYSKFSNQYKATIGADFLTKEVQFEDRLFTLQGTMLIQMSEASALPVAIEMNQGCSVSDAWLLLRRLMSSCSAQPPRQSQLDPIDISP